MKNEKRKVILELYQSYFLLLEAVSAKYGRTGQRKEDVYEFFRSVLCPMSELDLRAILNESKHQPPFDMLSKYYGFLRDRR